MELNRCAGSERHDAGDDVAAGTLVLLDFLMGDSLVQVTARHRLQSVTEAEVLLRAALLRHGYTASDVRTR